MRLRDSASEPDPGPTRKPRGPRILTVASGKGGVGKTSLVANLGTLLARQGLRVLLVDGDLGLANLDIVLGVQPRATLEQVLGGEAELREALVGIEAGLWCLPAASGLLEARLADEETRRRLIGFFEVCPWEMDLILVDAGAGIQDNVLSLHGPLHESVVILTPEPTSMTDAYGLIKCLRRRMGVEDVTVVVNQVTDAREAQGTFAKLNEVAGRFLDVELAYAGHCPMDENFRRAVMKRRLLVDLNPGTPSVRCLELLAKRLGSGSSKTSQEDLGKLSGRTVEKAMSGAQQATDGRTAAPPRGLFSPRTESRFKEELAGETPTVGNTAGFFRTLLEVKA
jgi:flagellar biosynthesis protein FlhG